MNLKAVIYRLLTISCLLSAAHAGIGDDLMRFFSEVGIASNVSSPGYYQDQTAGYYTGGSLVTRNRTRNAQLATLQMPGHRAGCGGIDLWTGGFSHIKAQDLVNMLRSVGSNTASYAFMLAIQTVSPQIYGVVNWLNALATKINQANINSCEMSATLLGGVWPKSDQTSKHLCQAMGSNMGEFSDWSAARQGCGAKGDREGILRLKDRDPRYKDMLVGEFNLSWKAIQANAFLSRDQELAQLFMTLVGSLIAKQNGDSITITALVGHTENDEVISGLLKGGQTPIYQCDESLACLNPIIGKVNLPERSTLLYQVHEVLKSLINKIYADEAPTQAEQDFLNSTRLPLYKMLNVITAYRRGAAPLDIHLYEELIALDILYKYVMEVIDIVQESLLQLKGVQVDESTIRDFLQELSAARQRITERRASAFQQMDNTLSLIQATQLIEKQLHVMLGSVANETNWF